MKSFGDGSFHAATRQYDSAPSSFAFLALVTTSSGVGSWYVSIPVSKNADCPQNVQSSLPVSYTHLTLPTSDLV